MATCVVCDFFNENTESSEYAEYVNTRLNNDDPNIAELIDELKAFGIKFDCTKQDLESHRDNCLPLTLTIRNELDQEEINIKDTISNIDSSDSLEIFKIKNPIEQQGMCDILLNEINFKILYIINEKLNLFKDKIPKDDIQAFKIINDIIAKPDIENVNAGTITTIEDLSEYSNQLANRLIQTKYLTKEEAFDLVKFLTNKDIVRRMFKHD